MRRRGRGRRPAEEELARRGGRPRGRSSSSWQPEGPGQRGFFLASSAGGVYAGASGASVHRAHRAGAALAVRPRQAAVGEARHRVRRRAPGRPLLVGRLSNLYGPGQDLAKPQGLVSAAVPGPADPAAAEHLRLAGHPARLPLRRRRRRDGGRRGSTQVDRPRRARAQGARQRALDDRRRRARRPAPDHPAPAAGRARVPVGAVRASRCATCGCARWPGRRPSAHGAHADERRDRRDADRSRPMRTPAPVRSAPVPATHERHADATPGHRRRRVHRQPLRAHRAHRRLGRTGARAGRGARQAHLRRQPREPRARAATTRGCASSRATSSTGRWSTG